MTKILLTGGGTAGHVMPNIALLPYLSDMEIHYVGRGGDAIEKKLISKFPNVIYHEIHAGKLRRYLSWENIQDFFRFLIGIVESKRIVKKINPDIIFSKGGFVSVPVVLAAKKKFPIITHESDVTPGLANKIITKHANLILTTFKETVDYLPAGKAVCVGSPVRETLLSGNKEKGLEFLGFNGEKPILLIMGGSLGASSLNKIVRENVSFLTGIFDVCHICGDNDINDEYSNLIGYKQVGFIGDELPDVLSATDFVITRGGSNAICEFAALLLPMIIIPLGMKSSRGDQILNAEKFVKDGLALSISQDDITKESFEDIVNELVSKKDTIKENLEKANFGNGTKEVFRIISETLNNVKNN